MAVVLALDAAIGLRSLPSLHETPGVAAGEAPSVSIVVAARNEEEHIAAALATLRAQDYPDFEVIAVDDRSTDRTGEILDGLGDGRVRVLHIDTLPDGWLGKNHALHRGAEQAAGALILFTDADVMMEPGTLGRAVELMRRESLDHLAVAPRIGAGGPWATMTLAVFLVVFSAVFRPWKARDPRSRHHIGIGAFNMVRAEVYRAIGGHASVALRPDDDVRLGRRIKEAGFRQAAASGRECVRVDWYPSLRAMARGLRKNSFAAVDYRLGVIIAGTLPPLVFIFWPLAALAVTDGALLVLNALIVATGVFSVWHAARGHGLPPWVALAWPLGSLFLLWIVWSATIRALRTGGIEWRDTRYSLDELRRG